MKTMKMWFDPKRVLAVLCTLMMLLTGVPIQAAQAATGTVTPSVSPENVKINMFDYWLTNQNDADNAGAAAYSPDGDIHYNHVLFFGKREIEGNVDAWPDYNKTEPGVTTGRPNMVQAQLGSNGFPVLNGLQNPGRNGGAASYESLAYLFDPNTDNRVNYWTTEIDTNDKANQAGAGQVDGKASYTNVNGLLRYGDYAFDGGATIKNAYYYDSLLNFAQFDMAADNGSFTLYNVPAIAPSTDGVADGQFFPFNTLSEVDLDTSCMDSKLNHYFGMTMETTFYMPANGKIDGEDMVFHFSGDDDVWIFVDGYLVGDVGGLHSPAGVNINFATKQVTYTGTGRTATAFPAGLTLAPNTAHTLKMFYMERGNYDSNLSVAFNLYYPNGDFALAKVVADADATDKAVPFGFDIGFDFFDVEIGTQIPASYIYSASNDGGEDETGTVTINNGVITAVQREGGGTSAFFTAPTAPSTAYRVSLKHGETVTLKGLPDETKVTTTEAQSGDYNLTSIVNSLTSEGNSTDLNNRTATIKVDIDSAAESRTTYTNTKTPLIGNLKITKTTTGATTPADTAFVITSPEGFSETVYYRDFTLNGAVYEYTRSDLPIGNYTVTETQSTAAITNYTLTVSGDNATPKAVSDGATTGFAINNAYSQDVGNLEITKTTTGATTPADTAFTITGTNYSETVTYSQFTNGKYTLTNLPVGNYTVTEKQSTATVANYTLTISGDNATAKLVSKGQTTGFAINNAYSQDVGGLMISKVVTGTAGDKDRSFDFVIGLSVRLSGTYSGLRFQNGFATLRLKHGQSLTVLGLPAGVTYEVRELDTGDYIVTSSHATGVIPVAAIAPVAFTNHLDRIIPPPVTGDDQPILLYGVLFIFALAGIAISLYLSKRRYS